MPRPVCVPCRREMTLATVGVVVQFDAIVTLGAYEQWHGDLAQCPSCGAQVVFRYASQPSWSHFRKRQAAPDAPFVVVGERPNVLAPDAKVCPICGEQAIGTDPIDFLGLCTNKHTWSLATRAVVENAL